MASGKDEMSQQASAIRGLIPPNDEIRQRLIEHLRLLVSIPTAFPPGETTALCGVLAPKLSALGYHVTIQGEVAGLDNLIAEIGSGAPTLVFNVHADTVGVGDIDEWHGDPFTLFESDGQLRGLGAANCKGSLAVYLLLAEQLAAVGGPQRGRVSFNIVTDEESLGSHGTDFLRRSGLVKPDYLIVAAPTGNAISTAERSVLWIVLDSFGKAAHAGSPWLGDNAVERMVRLVSRLQRDLMPQIKLRQGDDVRSTLNIGQIHGGSNTNMVPDFCRVQIDRRLLHSEDPDTAFGEIIACLAAADEPEGSWNLQMVRCTNAYRSPRDGILVAALADAVASVTGRPAVYSPAVGVSDGHYFARDGIEIVNIGPGAGGGHDSNETVPIDQMIEAARIQLLLIDKLLGTGS